MRHQDSKARLQTYLDEIKLISVLTRPEELTLIPAAKAGDKAAFDRVIRANLKFVVSVALEYEGQGMSLMDIISEGNLGLIRALETFDPTRGYRFITYAKWWIRQNIIYALIYKNHTVRIPQSQLRKLRSARKSIDRLRDKSGVNRMSLETLEKLAEQEAVFRSISAYLGNQSSLDTPIGNDQNGKLLDILPDDASQSPDQDIVNESLQTALEEALLKLKEREIQVLKMLFGLDGHKKQTLGDVGARYGISRERVRQIKNEALEKLRASKAVHRNLSGYLA